MSLETAIAVAYKASELEKALRRVIRGAYLGKADLGDLSALENPRAVQAIRELSVDLI